MKYGSLSKIFIGLILVFFNINILHLNILTNLLGLVLITTAEWQLIPVNKSFKSAFIFGTIQLAIAALNLVLICLQLNNNMGITITVICFGIITMLAMLCNLFSGLSQLAQGQGDDYLEKKLGDCFGLYVILTFSVLVALLIPFLVIIMIPAAVIIYVYILNRVNKLRHLIDGSFAIYPERSLDKRYFLGLGIFAVLTLTLCVSALVYKSNPTVDTEIYKQNDVTEIADIQSIRKNMLALGFKPEIIYDLPDSEAARYKNVVSVQSSMYQQTIDGGMLAVTQYASTFSGGATRILYYFKWLTPPDHKYCDEFYEYLPSQLLYEDETSFNGFGLYDREGPNGQATYKADFVKTEPVSMTGRMHTEVIYRIFGNEAKNQRGFFAYNAQVKSPKMEINYNSIVNYSHQKSIFNFNFSNETNSNSQQIMLSAPGVMTNNSNRAAYDRSQFIFDNKYKP